jgi:hypothetical protein
VVEEFPLKNVMKELVEMAVAESSMVVEDLVMVEDLIFQHLDEVNLVLLVEMEVNMMLIMEEVEGFVLGMEKMEGGVLLVEKGVHLMLTKVVEDFVLGLKVEDDLNLMKQV